MKKNLKTLTEELVKEENFLRKGGNEEGHQRQKRCGRMFARERIKHLIDDENDFFELGVFAAWKMYDEWGDLPAAGVITGIGKISQHECMIIANDATVKAGAMFPQSIKKVLRAQRIAFECRLPVIYLVDSSGVFLPLQEDIFPDEDDFGRIFRNNSVMSAANIPQIAAIMGNCIAGGGYLPVLCDKVLMTEGSGLYLAGPALVKAAIGQIVDSDELGGAKMHSEISGTVDFYEKDDLSCLKKIRSLVSYYKVEEEKKDKTNTKRPIQDVYKIIDSSSQNYDIHEILDCIVDVHSFEEYKESYGKSLVCGYARIEGCPIGIIANQRIQTVTGKGKIEIGGVVYAESADKASRFIMDCNQMKIPILFLQDVMGFMVGKEAEQSGIIRSGAKLVNAVSNSIVPKITLVIGNSFGAGNYALCGKAYDPNFILAWPNSKFAVMGAEQAADTLFSIKKKAAERNGQTLDEKKAKAMHEEITKRYQEQMDIRYGAARGFVDAIIEPCKTREILGIVLRCVNRSSISNRTFHTGVIQT